VLRCDSDRFTSRSVEYNVKEAQYALDHLHEWMKPERVPSPLGFESGHIRVRRDPLGVTFIIGAWNEPWMLTSAPLVAAIAGGNTAVIKPTEVGHLGGPGPSSYPSTSTPRPSPWPKAGCPRRPHYWTRSGTSSSSPAAPRSARSSTRRRPSSSRPRCSNWAARTPPSCTRRPISALRRAGSPSAATSTPGTSAPRLTTYRCGEVKDEFVQEVKNAIPEMYGDDPKESPDYGRVINLRSFERLVGYLDSGSVAAGDHRDAAERYIAPR
jgi:aldehyde dehydrogenase (NAD+)